MGTRTRAFPIAAVAAALLSGCLALPDRKPTGVAAGWLETVRTELGGGSGWTVDASFTAENGDPWYTGIGATTHDEDGLQTKVWRASWGLRFGLYFTVFDLSWTVHVDDDDGWGTGPRIGYGVGVFRERYEVYVLPAAYVWLGGKDTKFDAGVEGEIRLVAGVRF